MVFRVPPLSSPLPGGGIDAVMNSHAGRLFVDLARLAWGDFRLTDEDAEAVGHICRPLDGLPLRLSWPQHA